MRFDLQNTIFQGFINYGTPIRRNKVTLTENLILMPVFETADRYKASALVRHGNYLLVGPFHKSRSTDSVLDHPNNPLHKEAPKPRTTELGDYLLVHTTKSAKTDS